MFILYKSYRFDLLLKKACSIFIQNPLHNPLNSEIFVTPNAQIDYWIKIFIANKYLITANINFLKFNTFVWKIFQNFSSHNYSNLEFTRYYLIWKMMNLKNIKHFSNFISKSNSKIKLFEILSFLSKTFEQYLIYRPDWIKKWQENSKKQNNTHASTNQYEVLWIELIKYMNSKHQSTWNFSNILFYLENKFKKKLNITQFPPRIFIFENTYLTPYHLIILKQISQLCDIHFFYTTPYQYEEQLLSKFNKIKKCNINLTQKNAADLLKTTRKFKIFIQKKINIHNSMNYIASWGEYGLENTVLLNLIQKKQVNIFNTKETTCLLQKIQKNIIQNNFLKNNNINKINIHNEKKYKIFKNDKSLAIHVCLTLRREIEVLHDNLLNILNTNHDILFHDILIISKNINIYTPYIYSIFNKINGKNYIPFFILSDTYLENKTTIFKIVIEMLDLPNISLDNEKILNLLSNVFILKKFKIKSKEIIILHKIIQQSCITFEADSTNETYESHINHEYNNLSIGEENIFLGRAMNDINYITWNKNVPYQYLSTKHYKIFGKFVTFSILLKKWKKILSTEKSLKHWKILFEQFLQDFFINDDSEKQEIIFIKKQWNKIIDPGIRENYKGKISIKILKNELLNYNSQKINIHGCFSGKVTFCNGFKLRSIPFKVICILGMHEKFVIQKTSTSNLSLMYQYPRICDPHRPNKYKYLFLETLLSTKKFLLISYYKNSEHTNSIHEQSLIINQLFLYISKNFYISKKYNNKCKCQNINKLLLHIYYFHTNELYSTKNFYHNYKFHSFSQTWFKISQLTRTYKNNFEKPLPKIQYKHINMFNLISFWKNPIRYFFNQRLHVKLNLITTNNLYQEDYFIKAIDRYWINVDILNFLLYRKSIKKLFLYYKYKGIIPSGNIGKIYWNNQLSLITPLYEKINLQKKKLRNKKFCIQTGIHFLYGLLKNINTTGLLRWTPSIIKNTDIISLWLEHLVYCCIYNTGDSIMFGLKNTNLTFHRLKKNQASHLLNKYVSGYIEGMTKPILLTNTGINWINYIYDKNNKNISTKKQHIQKAKSIMLQTWEGNNWKKGEKDDLYIKRTISTLNDKNIFQICETSKIWMLPILKHIKYN
ncbi:MAG: exodeoxyribonuclease V subunit gamma [Buchnera aphidicola (Schlechtendalia peitan)]